MDHESKIFEALNEKIFFLPEVFRVCVCGGGGGGARIQTVTSHHLCHMSYLYLTHYSESWGNKMGQVLIFVEDQIFQYYAPKF